MRNNKFTFDYFIFHINILILIHTMPQIKASFGPITIADEPLQPGTSHKATQRSANDPLNFIKISCEIPKESSYAVGLTDIFNFGEELDKLQLTKYT